MHIKSVLSSSTNPFDIFKTYASQILSIFFKNLLSFISLIKIFYVKKMTVTACIPSLKNIILCLLYLKCLLLNHLTSQVSKQQQIILMKYLFDLATKPISPQLKSEKLVFTIVNCIYSIIIKICIIMNAYIHVLMDCNV